jgi:transcriptional regulator with XRE-family HTH domain
MKPIELARRAKMDRGYLSRILQGRASPSLDILERIADALAVSVQSLFEGEPDEIRDLTADLQRDPKLKVMLRSLRELSDDDRQQILSIIQRFEASQPALNKKSRY